MSCSFVSIFFFFKQKTAYEMRISDWSSDVCSSDLDQERRGLAGEPGLGAGLGSAAMDDRDLERQPHDVRALQRPADQEGGERRGEGEDPGAEGGDGRGDQRSDERRVGKECVSTRISRCAPYH